MEYRQFEKQDSNEVHKLAFDSWKFTYKKIYPPDFIEKFVNQNYDPKKLGALIPQIKSGKMFFYVVIDKPHVVGFCHIGDRGSGMELFRIYLKPNYIGQGIGEKLLSFGESFVKSKGLHKYFCFVHKKNKIGIKFYLKNNFKHIQEKDEANEWYMEKKL